jgi:S-adenosylmethionine hydrolase
MNRRSPARPIITLLTDFGQSDGYVAQMKGILLAHAPEAQLVDITHEVPPFQVAAAGRILSSVYPSFPAKTVHLAVVDPGVGGTRKAIIIKAAGQWFVGPDNGLFSSIVHAHPRFQAFEISKISGPISATFHGRDIFAPVAAQLSLGKFPGKQKKSLKNIREIPETVLQQNASSGWFGKIIALDHFGNAVTNLPESLVLSMRRPCLEVGSLQITAFFKTYSEAPFVHPLVVVDSQGFLEIAVREGSAAQKLRLRPGRVVSLCDLGKRPGKGRK